MAHYAAELHVTPRYLSYTIKRVTGKPVSAHINEAVTAITLEYLKNGQLSVSQIAEEVNFSSLSYFSRFCVKHIGVSPVRIRTTGEKINLCFGASTLSIALQTLISSP
ncbi:MAG: helix-turn-helix domain-containing protein [Muribaculaceae bacterium]|nr:helix-turn-helix domain-containing protein [Muribaculaceae bacterium]